MIEHLITAELLTSTGIIVPTEQLSPLLDYMNSVLEDRVGEEIVESLNDDQLEELVKLQEGSSDEEVQTWLETNVFDLTEIIKDEIDIILGEAAEHHADFSSK
jgi:predicted house-cleaning noncanonical NTP pyrophosphatase (MazG superfamily)